MADNDSIKLTQTQDFKHTRDIYLSKNDNQGNKSENLNILIPQISINEETVKEGIKFLYIENLSNSSSTISSNNIRQQSTFLSNSNKNQVIKGAFNNFQALINHKNYLLNHHPNYLFNNETSKHNYFHQNSLKNINFDSKNKNIFQTVNLIKNKNLKIIKEEKQSQSNLADNNNISNINSHININNSLNNNVASKKTKSNEAHLDFLISISIIN